MINLLIFLIVSQQDSIHMQQWSADSRKYNHGIYSNRQAQKNSTNTSNQCPIHKCINTQTSNHYFSNQNIKYHNIAKSKSPTKIIQSRNAYYGHNKQKSNTHIRQNSHSFLIPQQPHQFNKHSSKFNSNKRQTHLKRENILSDPKQIQTKSISLKKIKSIGKNGLIDSDGKIIISKNHKKMKSSINMNSLQSHNFLLSKVYHSKQECKINKLQKKDKPTNNHKKTKSHFKKKKKKNQKDNSINLISKLEYQNSYLHYKSDYQIDIQYVKKDIANQIQNINFIPKFILSKTQRLTALQFLGQICDKIQLRRETFFLALTYLDLYLHIQSFCQNVFVVACAALFISIKIDQSEMIGNFVSFFSKPARHSSKASSQKKHKKSISYQGKLSKQKSTKEVKSVKNSLKPQKQYYLINKNQIDIKRIYQKQIQIIVKLNFKLYHRTIADWSDLLTSLWDQYIYDKHSLADNLFFRRNKNTRLVSHLIQIIELSYLSLNGYKYNKVALILSIMYLLVRITIELDKRDNNYETTYQYYKKSLKKSSNIIFIDTKGTNQIFGDFLNTIDLSLGDLVSCCQFVSQFLVSQIFTILKQNNLSNHEHNLALYQYNKLLFQYINKSLQN